MVALSGSAAAFIDLRTRRVPNPAVLVIALVGLGLAVTHAGSVTPGAALAGLVIGFALMMPGHLFGATGAGDVKLFAAMGTLLGPGGAFTAFLYTAVAGGVLAAVIAVRRRCLGDTLGRVATLVGTGGGNVAEIESRSVNNRFAYAPAIAVGTLAAALGF